MVLRLICREYPKLQGLVIGRNIMRTSAIQSTQRLISTAIKKHGFCATTAFNFKTLKCDVPIDKRLLSLSAVRLSAQSDHSKLWVAEKALSAALLGIVPLALTFPNVLLDDLMILAVVLHTHWGIEGIVIDYVRPVIFGHFIPKITLFLVYLLSILTLAGLLNFNHNNMGLSKAIRRFWTAERYIEEDGDIPPE